MESDGKFVAQGRHDILVEAIGRPEHSGRVRAAGQRVGIKLYFGVSKRSRHPRPKRMKLK